MKKKCNKCGAKKNLSEFETSSRARDGYRASCIACIGLENPKTVSDVVKAGTINKLAGTYVPEKHYYREDGNKQYKSRGYPC